MIRVWVTGKTMRWLYGAISERFERQDIRKRYVNNSPSVQILTCFYFIKPWLRHRIQKSVFDIC